MPPKRKRVVLSMKDKSVIIEHLEKGESVTKISHDYGIGKSTVCDIYKQKDKITEFLSQASDHCSFRKTMKLSHNQELDNLVYKWFLQQRSQGEAVSGPNLCEIALQMNRLLNGPDDFKASTGWLNRFKLRHGICQLETRCEKLLPADKPQSFKNFLAEFLDREGYSLENVYNADETCLNWKSLPKAFVADECITVIVCSNATGTHRLPLLLIGKVSKCFKHVNIGALPFKYILRKSVQIDSSAFCEWYSSVFLPSVKLHQHEKQEKTLLLIDRAPYHPSSEIMNAMDESTRVMLLPPNTALQQPIRQGISVSLKNLCRKQLLCHLLLACKGSKESVTNLLQKLNLKDYSYLLVEAWASIPEYTLKNAWRKLLKTTDMEGEGGKDDQVGDILEVVKSIRSLNECSAADVQEWLNCDEADPGCQLKQGSAIMASVSQNMVNSSSEPEEEEVEIPSSSNALAALETALMWYEAQEESDLGHISALRRVRDLAEKKSVSTSETSQN